MTRILRLCSQRGAVDLKLIDEKTEREVPDVLRLAPAPIELHDARWFATISIHERDVMGNFRYDNDGTPITSTEFVELRVGTIWAI